MSVRDTRRLSPQAQEVLRLRVMAAVEAGTSQAAAARLFGVSRQSVNGWARRRREQGARGLHSRPRGRPPSIRLKPYQAATVEIGRASCRERV